MEGNPLVGGPAALTVRKTIQGRYTQIQPQGPGWLVKDLEGKKWKIRDKKSEGKCVGELMRTGAHQADHGVSH